MSEVTRSVHATSPPAAARVASQRRAQPNGWWGAALLVATESALFGCMIASYFYLYSYTTKWPPPGVERPSVALPLVLAAVLVATCVPMFLAARAAQAGRVGTTAAWVTLALAVQVGYLAVQIVELKSNLDSFSPRTGGAYASAYYTLLIAHHAHVLLGILLSAWLLTRLARGLTNYRVVAARVIALYWYFVAVVGVAVTLTLVSPSL
jgi:heme/copper-type cytochrome/quinol oxidase subunit 3